MSKVIFSQTVKDTLDHNSALIMQMKAMLERSQLEYRLTRQQLSEISQHLMTLGYLIAQSTEMHNEGPTPDPDSCRPV